MPDYMEALLEISGAAMVSNQEMEPNVVLQGIEFWNTASCAQEGEQAAYGHNLYFSRATGL